MVAQKLTAIWRIITCSSFHLFSQRRNGSEVGLVAEGRGDIEDMVLVAKALKDNYNQFIELINEAATEGGELHALEQLKRAIDTLEKQQ